MATPETFNPDISTVRESEQRRAQARNGNNRQRQENNNRPLKERLSGFFRTTRTRIALGAIVLFFGFFLLISFVSFLAGGDADQSRVASYTMIENAKESGMITNAGKAMGASLSNLLIADGVGLAAFVLVGWCGVIGIRLLRRETKVKLFVTTLITLFTILAFSLLLGTIGHIFGNPFFPLGGYAGEFAILWINNLMGPVGMLGITLIVLMLWCFACNFSIKKWWGKVPKPHFGKPANHDADNHTMSVFRGDLNERNSERETTGSAHLRSSQSETSTASSGATAASTANATSGATPPRHNRAAEHRPATPTDAPNKVATLKPIEHSTQVTNPNDPTGEYRHYQFPGLDLMQQIDIRTDRVDVEEQETNKQRIKEALGNYGITIKHIDVHVGPTVTLFEIVPDDGVRIAKIRGLEDDIAMTLSALGIRIIAPMPGRGTIGIEVPNRDPQVVPMREVLASKAFQESKAILPMALGCTVSNEVFVADLAKMPHLLVAGATGKGKSVGLNAIITSLLYKKGPSELKFVLVDPKRVEFSVYADIEKYFFALAPDEERGIITDTDRVVKVLNCLVQEMENRYRVLEEVKVRKVEDYNQKWRRELREVRNEHGEKVYRYMPYIVAIIDEFSDMIMTSGKEVETPIVRIAQKARAVGIHMIIATQRPSAKVITGLIKANFPGRIAFAVSQMVDSRIIIDRPGAQQLIGRGDMLFSVDGEITRLQCAFVDTPDIERLTAFIKQQEDIDREITHQQPYQLPEYEGVSGEGGGSGSADAGSLKDRDPLFDDAVRWIIQGETASTSSLQRRFEIGYNRAGRIMDQMEQAGIVGPSQGGKPRRILIDPADVDQLLGKL